MSSSPSSPLQVRGLSVALPDGRILLDGVDLEVAAGEVVVLLGGSGAGKSTFARVLFETEELERAGYEVRSAQLTFDRARLGLVPQRGALFDHLDVRGNLELAQRRAAALGGAAAGGPRATDRAPASPASPASNARATGDGSAASWLLRVGLDPRLAEPGTSVARLSGGQAQRVAVARVLASHRQFLFLDEPSVGLDPHRVRMLARLIREQVRTLGISAIIVTHDVALAGGVADRLFLLSLRSRKLEQLFPERWPGALEDLAANPADETASMAESESDSEPGAESDSEPGAGVEPSLESEPGAEARRPAAGHRARAAEAERGRWLIELEAALVDHLDEHGEAAPRQGPGKPRARLAAMIQRGAPLLAPFRVAGLALRHVPEQLVRHPRDVAVIAARTLRQTLLRPLLFYAVVSTLIGYTVLLVVSKVGGAGVRPDALLRQIGGSYVVALAPALSALLFVAASGSATNAWLGSMSLTKQTLALDALGVDHRSYLLAPAWLAVGLAYLVVASLFALGMIGGGYLVCRGFAVEHAWQLLTGDLIDPRPERAVYTWRAAFLIWVYAWGIASDVVAKGGAPKPEADAVTRAMTASVVACTLWVVGWELVTVLVVLR